MSDHKNTREEKPPIRIATAANLLLEREAEPDYIQEWTTLLMKEKEKGDSTTEGSVVIFRLGKEWLALSTLVVAQVAENRPVHSIPHRSNAVLAGIVNLGGQLKLCIRLHHFLEIGRDDAEHSYKTPLAYSRMIAIQNEEEFWIFLVDEVYGIVHCDFAFMENVPVTVSKSAANFLKGVMHWEGKSLGIINEDMLFYSLRRNLL